MSANKYTVENGQLIDVETGQIVDKKDVKKAYEKEIYHAFMKSHHEQVELGIQSDLRVVKDKRGNEFQSLNVKEGFHFVKVFKVDVRFLLESSKMSIFSRGFLYTCLAYINFPTNTLIINGQQPTNEIICDLFGIGKSKLYEVYKELEYLDVIKRVKVNGQWIIYINPFLHSTGLVVKVTYEMFKGSLYNPENRSSINN